MILSSKCLHALQGSKRWLSFNLLIGRFPQVLMRFVFARASLVFGVCSSLMIPLCRPASAEVIRRAVLPTAAAIRAVDTAVTACRERGMAVTATVVNTEGGLVAVLRGDGASPHTVENSFNKAYTAISLGPIRKLDSTAKLSESIKDNSGHGRWPMPPAPIHGFTFTAGGLVLFAGGEQVGGIGVSGAPNGLIDEACALQGRAAANALMR